MFSRSGRGEESADKLMVISVCIVTIQYTPALMLSKNLLFPCRTCTQTESLRREFGIIRIKTEPYGQFGPNVASSFLVPSQVNSPLISSYAQV